MKLKITRIKIDDKLKEFLNETSNWETKKIAMRRYGEGMCCACYDPATVKVITDASIKQMKASKVRNIVTSIIK